MHTQTILVAEDQAVLRELIEVIFTEQPYRLVFVADGEEALHQARELRPDLMLLDILLPLRSGIEICRIVKADPAMRHMKVVFVSAHTEREYQAREAGGDAFLAKPFSPFQLIGTVRALLAQTNKPDSDRPLGGMLVSAAPV